MIRIILKGGLGNQMFQYAAAKALALHNKTELILDLSYLKTRPPLKDFTKREYELDLFGVEDKTFTLLKLPILDKYFSYGLELIYNKFANYYYINEENPYGFDREFFNLGENTILEGYFTNIKYFEKYQKEIKAIFNLSKFYDAKFNKIETEIKNRNSVSINIRRGDYLNSKHKDIFKFLDENYYKEAINIINTKVKNPHFFVFSYDDPTWFEDTFKLDKSQYTMINKEYTGDKFKTYLRLISLCKHNIISNSTFAWWGAYLNKNKDKIVISPKNWMYKHSFENPWRWTSINN